MSEKKKRAIFLAYIDGSGESQDEWGNLRNPLFGYWIVKEGTFLDPTAPVKEWTRKPVVVKAKRKISNNMAEFLALKALLLALPEGSFCKVYSDSKLVVHSIGGFQDGYPVKEWKIKTPELEKIRQEILNLLEERNIGLSLEWIEREKNEFGKVLEKVNRKAARKRRQLYKRMRRARYDCKRRKKKRE